MTIRDIAAAVSPQGICFHGEFRAIVSLADPLNASLNFKFATKQRHIHIISSRSSEDTLIILLFYFVRIFRVLGQIQYSYNDY